MSGRTFKAFAAAAVLTTFGLALVNANGPDPMLKDIAGYRQWTRVTKKPIAVAAPAIDTLSFSIDGASIGG